MPEALKILLCDDDLAFRKLTRTYLRAASAREILLEEAGRKEEIQAALDTGGFDLVLMDIQMPEKSGLDWLEEIVKKNTAPVVMLTGFGSEEIAVRALHKGAIDYIPKDSFSKDRLWGTVKAALETWKRKRAEEGLKHKNIELRRLNRDLNEYVHFVSHDLRAPLRHIKALSIFIKEDYGAKLDERGREFVSNIAATCDDAEAMINELLKLAKIRDSDVVLELVDLNEIIRAVETELEFFLVEHNGRLEVMDDLPIISAHRSWLKDLFVNLVTNGIKYNDNVEKVVRIGFEDRERGRVFFVADNGLGIEDDYKNEIFKPFKRLHAGKEGTGLGLTICRKVVEAQGGKIWVESEQGKGSTFFFSIPQKTT